MRRCPNEWQVLRLFLTKQRNRLFWKGKTTKPRSRLSNEPDEEQSILWVYYSGDRRLTQLTMTFCYRNSIDMPSVYVEILSDGLKTTYTIVIKLSKLVTLYLGVRPLFVLYLKGQLWVHCYFCFILMICQTVQANHPSESLL